MASTAHVALAALVALVAWSSLGAVLLRRLVPAGLVLPFAPIVGWAIHNAIAVPVFFVVPFTTATVIVVFVAVFAIAFVATRAPRPAVDDAVPRLPLVAVALALFLAAACAAAILPKVAGDAVVLADPVFDHAKVAIVDDIARLGMPPGNPFFAHDGLAGRLAYYYLWHFSAAGLARVLPVSGWEADAAMTFFSAFSSLLAMMGLAMRFAGRAAAAAWVPLFAASSSVRGVAIALFGAGAVDAFTTPPGGFAGWLFQSSWVPQHLAATSCVLVAVYLMSTLPARADASRVVVLALVVAAGFESSTWIGGVAFAVAALVVVPIVVWSHEPAARARVFGSLAIAGLVAAIVAWPFVRDQLAASALRQGSSPIALDPFPVLGGAWPDALRRVLDVPAYWLVLLPLEFAAIYLTGLASLRRLVRDTRRARPLVAFAALAFASLACAGLLRSTLADNNDLAWRAALLASTALVVFAAAGLATWIGARERVPVVLALVVLAAGLPEAARLVRSNLDGVARPGARAFAEAPALWARVREIAAPDERVANDPRALGDLTPWPVNIGWSLLADRRSCYAAWELDQVYTSVPHDRLRAINDRFERVFGGSASEADVDDVATNHDCRVFIVTRDDGAWTRDPFARDARFVLVDARPDRWRIYRRRD